jgi:hypothetical protein
LSTEHAFLTSIISAFQSQKRSAEKAIVQLPDDKLHVPLDANTNSVAVIMRHMAGNLRSRFTDFLTTDGEKPDRNRDGEFELDSQPDRVRILADWENGWSKLFGTLDALTPSDLLRDVYIRGERHSVIQALNRQLTHHAYHAGQIVFLAKHFRSADWKTLSMPRRRS